MPVLSLAEALLPLHKCNIAKAAPEAQEWQRNRRLTKFYSTLPVSYKQAP